MIIYVCENDFESMMSCIYDVWAAKQGSENVYLTADPDPQYSLFDETVYLQKDDEKAQKVIRSIQTKISWYAYRQIFLAAMTREKDRVDCIYRFLRYGFSYGSKVTQMLGEKSVMRLFELSRRVSNELHYYREFTRFSRIDSGVYVAHIEPDSQIAALVADHFQDRMPSEYWMIIDDNRRIAAVHPKDYDFYLTELTEEETERLKKTEFQNDEFVELWKAFFKTIGIKERENKACQKSHFPLHYRKHVVEFLDEMNCNGS